MDVPSALKDSTSTSKPGSSTSTPTAAAHRDDRQRSKCSRRTRPDACLPHLVAARNRSWFRWRWDAIMSRRCAMLRSPFFPSAVSIVHGLRLRSSGCPSGSSATQNVKAASATNSMLPSAFRCHSPISRHASTARCPPWHPPVYAAALTAPDATVVQQTALALGAELQAIQLAHERLRRSGNGAGHQPVVTITRRASPSTILPC